MFDWLKKKTPSLQPENRWLVMSDGDQISVRDYTGLTKPVGKDDLSGIVIETNDSGPWGADVWWLLFDANDQLACAYPQGATGEDGVLDYLTALPSFDHSEMAKAMSSTDSATFIVWRRSS